MLIKVKVFPGEKREEIIEKEKDSFEVKVKVKPERGEANKKVLELLSLHFKTPKNRIRMVKGGKQRNKIYDIIEK